MVNTYIYALRDPRDGKVFYVGKTVNLLIRFADHCLAARREKNPLRRRKILELREQGFKPMLHILETCSDDWKQREIFWISEYARLGHPLCNSHVGGSGWPYGIKQNPLVVKRRADAIRGRKRPEELKERIRQANLRTWANKDLRERHKAFAATGERLKKLHSDQKNWLMSLSSEERSKRAKVASDAAKKSCGNKNWLMSLSPEERRLRAITASEAAKAVNRKVRHG